MRTSAGSDRKWNGFLGTRRFVLKGIRGTSRVRSATLSLFTSSSVTVVSDAEVAGGACLDEGITMRIEPAGLEAELLLDRRAMMDVSCEDEGFKVAKTRISM